MIQLICYLVIAANPYSDGDDLCYFVTINPVNFEIVYSGISTRKVSFYFINDNKFYSSHKRSDSWNKSSKQHFNAIAFLIVTLVFLQKLECLQITYWY
jgi:hypothetical protein